MYCRYRNRLKDSVRTWLFTFCCFAVMAVDSSIHLAAKQLRKVCRSFYILEDPLLFSQPLGFCVALLWNHASVYCHALPPSRQSKKDKRRINWTERDTKRKKIWWLICNIYITSNRIQEWAKWNILCAWNIYMVGDSNTIWGKCIRNSTVTWIKCTYVRFRNFKTKGTTEVLVPQDRKWVGSVWCIHWFDV